MSRQENIIISNQPKSYLMFCIKDAIELGLEKSIILQNIEVFNNYEFDSLHKAFPFINEKVFYTLLKQLIDEKYVKECK
jgi:hypothetical protein